MDTLILDFSFFIYFSIFILVFKVPLENLILEKPTVGWIAFFLLLVSGWALFLLPDKIFLDETDKHSNKNFGISIILISILIILFITAFYYAPEWNFIKGQSLYNKKNVFIVLSIFLQLYVTLGIIYTRAKKWLILIPILIFTIVILNRFDYNSIINLWLLSFSPFIVGSLTYRQRGANIPINNETYKGD